jgi:hypothetical protein
MLSASPTSPASEAVRCSAWARAEKVDPIGSAGSYMGFLLVEVALPWPRDISEIPEVGALSDMLDGRRLRVQAVLPTGGPRLVVAYVRGGTEDGRFAGYARRQAAVVDGDLRAAVADALDGVATEGGAADVGHERDLLVCTHGRRDVCCGSLGTELALGTQALDLPEGVRCLRTSHTGGHRFAPTFIVLPEGTAWAFADLDLVSRVMWRRGSTADVVDRYRGCSGLGGPRVQALEREVFRVVGWDLLDRPRAARVLGEEVVELAVDNPDGTVDLWRGAVVPGRVLAVPDCMRPLGEAKKSETEWTVRDVALVASE